MCDPQLPRSIHIRSFSLESSSSSHNEQLNSVFEDAFLETKHRFFDQAAAASAQIEFLVEMADVLLKRDNISSFQQLVIAVSGGLSAMTSNQEASLNASLWTKGAGLVQVRWFQIHQLLKWNRHRMNLTAVKFTHCGRKIDSVRR